MPSLVIRVILGAPLLTAVQMIGGMAHGAVSNEAVPTPPADPLPWEFAASLVDVAALTWIATRSRLRGWRLALGIGALLFGIAHFNSLIEARFFGLFGTAQTLGYLAMTFATVLVFAPLFVLLLGAPVDRQREEAPQQWSARITPLRFVTAAVAYVVTYFAAGIMVLPFVREFYATKPMPDPLELIALQVLLRGPVFVILLYMLLRVSRAGRVEAVLMAGTVLSVIGGVAPQMVPNPYLPDAVR